LLLGAGVCTVQCYWVLECVLYRVLECALCSATVLQGAGVCTVQC